MEEIEENDIGNENSSGVKDQKKCCMNPGIWAHLFLYKPLFKSSKFGYIKNKLVNHTIQNHLLQDLI